MLTFMTLLVFLLSHFQATQQTENSEENGNEEALSKLSMDISPFTTIEGGTQLNITCTYRSRCTTGKARMGIHKDGEKKDLTISYDSAKCYGSYIKESATVSDSGAYECQWSSNNYTEETEPSQIIVRELLSNPEVKLLKGSSEVMIGQNVTITCLSGSGSLPVSYTLFRDNQKLFTETKSERKPATFILTIKSASDIGKYTCKATNEIRKEAKYSKSFIFTLIEAVSQPVLSSPTSRVKTGQNVTLFCLSENGSHPITYRFFRGNKSISPPICVEGKAAANISLTIKSSNFLGDYKCKAENKIPNSKKYSNSLRFTLSEKAGISYLLCISLVVFLLLVVMVIAVAIPFLFLPWYKARKLKSPKSATGFVSDQTESETCVIYTEIANNESDQQQYANISIIRKEKGDRVNLSTDTVDYSEVFISRIQGMLKENHLSL
ncbi:PREDICTED: allergin-1 isoform X1 [Crocodylus porosus]|uniref:allergin-1 isoform X1 n=1 Tax=Crocodylus porosus TaxID=8502 RepID=UPI00093B226C|nr:PREDICTED: allergin-1 isoform X1 [Crocodylus porosus]